MTEPGLGLSLLVVAALTVAFPILLIGSVSIGIKFAYWVLGRDTTK